MPKTRKYRVPNPEGRQRVRAGDIDRAARCRDFARSGVHLHHWNLSAWLDTSLKLAGSALAFELDDSVVAAHFAESIEAARLWLANGQPWQPKPQPATPKVTHFQGGDFTFEVIEMPPRMAEIGWMKDWDAGTFETVVTVLLAFGTADDVERAAAVPDVAYRSPDVVPFPSALQWLTALKAWSLGHGDDARAACRELLDETPLDLPKGLPRGFGPAAEKRRAVDAASARAMVALLDGDGERFNAALRDVEVAHVRFIARVTFELRFYALTAMALARIGRSKGLRVEEMPGVPIRFLPD